MKSSGIDPILQDEQTAFGSKRRTIVIGFMSLVYKGGA